MAGLACLIVISALLMIAPAGSWGPIYDLVFALVLSPLLVWLGAQVEPPRRIAPGARLLGEVSYALYAVHWGLIGPFRYLKDDLHFDPVLMAFAFLGTGVLLAWLAVRWIDIPARRLLATRKRDRAV